MKPTKLLLSVLPFLLLAESVWPFQVAELKRVTTTQDSSGQITRKEEPAEKSSGKSKKVDVQHDEDPHSFLGDLLQGILNVLFSPSPPEANSSGNTFRTVGPFLELRESRNVTLETGFVYSRVFNRLESRFNSPSFSQIRWDNTVNLQAPGAEATLLYGVADYFSLGINAGGFGSSRTANAQREGGTYVREDVSVSGGWGTLEGRLYPLRWLSLEGNLGVLVYNLHTSISTNASSYSYVGFEGSHPAFIGGLGGRIETPWSYPLRLYVGGRYWWTGGDGTPSIETGVAQFTTGLTWRF